MTVWPYPDLFISYLAEYFGSRDFFECHELMEELWKLDKGSEREGCWLVLVRLAVAQYHSRRGNGRGAYKLLGKACGEADPDRLTGLGLDGALLAGRLRERLADWGSPEGVFYAELDIPIADARLLRLAMERCEEQGWTWGRGLTEVASETVHRHAFRDRSDVIAARARAAEDRASRRSGTQGRPPV